MTFGSLIKYRDKVVESVNPTQKEKGICVHISKLKVLLKRENPS